MIPVIKNKAGKITSKDNYRPIALASLVSKVVEIIILHRYLLTNPNQFGFKKKLGTDQCIYVLKEIIDMYRVLNGSVFISFLDASKAFDRVNHSLLFDKLLKRGVPGYIVRLLVFWYTNQKMCVRWGNVYLDYFGVSNGVRQGGILSPLLFNLYMDDLSDRLNKLKIGCCINGIVVNHIMYADDLVLIAPSVAGMNKILKLCEGFGSQHDIKYNPMKSCSMSFRSKLLKGVTLPKFVLNGEYIDEVEQSKYLGHIFTNDLTDNADIARQFHMCTPDVKLTLFRTYCTPMYTSQLWWSYRKATINKLYTSYHNILKMFLGLSKFESTSMLCTYVNVQCCQSVIRSLVYCFLLRLDSSDNVLVQSILRSSLNFVSRIRVHWMNMLYTTNFTSY